MGKKTCENCEQAIGNLEESFLYKNSVVCKACKILLEEDSQAIEAIHNNAETEIPIAEILPQVAVNTEHESTADLVQQDEQEKGYGGIRRLGYFFGMTGVAVINAVFTGTAQGEPSIAFFGIIVISVLPFVLIVNRLHNTGMSGWWSLLTLVPIVNLFVGVRCLMCPEGYQDTKILDTAGKVIAGIIIGPGILAVVGLVVYFAK